MQQLTGNRYTVAAGETPDAATPVRNAARHLLIVEDDIFVLGLLGAYLEKESFRISRASSGAEMMAVLAREAVDAIVLDLNLPDEDGLALARMIRARSRTPIIVLTVRTERADRLAALKIGVDDYLVKPVDPEELALRLRNIVARCAPAADADGRLQARSLHEFHGWSLDVSARALHAPDGREVALSPAEFNILSALVQARGRVLSRAFLLDAISKGDSAPSERLIDVFISRLRRKLGRTGDTAEDLILTVPGHGYKLVR